MRNHILVSELNSKHSAQSRPIWRVEFFDVPCLWKKWKSKLMCSQYDNSKQTGNCIPVQFNFFVFPQSTFIIQMLLYRKWTSSVCFSSFSNWCIKHEKLQGREVPHMFNVDHEVKLFIGSKIVYIILFLQFFLSDPMWALGVKLTPFHLVDPHHY